MTRDDMVKFSAILTTLADFTEPVPASPIYLALGMNLAEYERLTIALSVSGLIVKTPETLGLTDKGRALAAKINTAVGKVGAA